ncbi:MAG: hypothetical protein WEG36_11760 [Gemmatimonadota bacterium]
MQRKFVAVAVMGLWAGVPAAASACDFSFAYQHLGVPPTQIVVGGGIHVSPLNNDDGDAFFMPAVGVGFRLGERAAVAPIIGYCSGDNDFGEVMFGGGGLFNLWNSSDGMVHLNLQSHVTYVSAGDYSYLTIPVMGSIAYDMSETLALFGNAGIVHYRESNGADFDDTNPGFSAGVNFLVQSFRISTGLTYIMGEHDDSLGLIAAISRPLGS